VATDVAALARSVFCVGYSGSELGSIPLAELRAFGPGGIIMFAPNVGAAAHLRASIRALRANSMLPPLIAVDQEGGRVARIADPALVAPLPSAMAATWLAWGSASTSRRVPIWRSNRTTR
jgi:beta-N-acetylhexosaminidase